MKYDFDTIIPRRGTNSYKWDTPEEENVLPMWVADMDFRTAPAIVEALQKRIAHGIFGYTKVPKAYYDAVVRWFDDRHRWQIDPRWIIYTNGVVPALSAIIKALAAPSDKIIVQTPAYNCFYSSIRNNGCELSANYLVYRDGRYTINFDDLETKAADPKAKILLLCNPHNPVGRVWTPEELWRIGDICLHNGVFVVADEIHCDFAFPEHPHTIFAKACPQLEEKMILCTAPSKTFNLAGLQVSNIWVPGKEIRDRFKAEINAAGYSQLNALGLIACQAAYENGGEWLEQCQVYLRENLKVLRSFLKERLPKIRLIEPEGTYFAWLDCSGLGLSDTALENLIAHQAKLWLDGGSVFDKKSGQFERIVLACTKKTLLQALTQLEAACRGRNS